MFVWKLVCEFLETLTVEQFKAVLILVCVEVSMWDGRIKQSSTRNREVLILVCVEVSMWDKKNNMKELEQQRLNPCLCGS